MNLQNQVRFAAVLAATALPLLGCDPGDPEIAESQQAVTVGDWVGPLDNGRTGPNPYRPPGGNYFTCEVLKEDGRWHPGKFFNSSCRIEYNRKAEKHFAKYRVLQSKSSYRVVSFSGRAPENIVTGTPDGLAICYSAYSERDPGKFWEGRCEYEFNDKRASAAQFYLLVE